MNAPEPPADTLRQLGAVPAAPLDARGTGTAQADPGRAGPGVFAREAPPDRPEPPGTDPAAPPAPPRAPLAPATLRATALGFGAVLLWSLLALFTVATAPVPPFLLNALTFAIATAAGLVWTVARGRLGVLRGVGARTVAFGTLGLFGYHALYFSALRLAPAAEASLVAYLWPLFLVLFSGLLPGERLRAGHLLGALAGLAGAALAISSRDGWLGFAPGPGHLLALGCALTWSLYSLLSRRFGQVPTEAVTLYCLATALLSLPAHLLFETTAWPQGAQGWLAVLGLGLGPVGLAFFVWDIGVKRGDIRLLGSASYAAPLLSTLFLVLAGQAVGGLRLALAALLITLGAALAMRASARKRDAAPG